jgi:nitroreductase
VYEVDFTMKQSVREKFTNLKVAGKRVIQLYAAFVLRRLAKRRFLVPWYYTFFSGAFRREQQAVLNGTTLFAEEARHRKNRYLLRRNTHRLEKGLVAATRRSVYAVNYIQETVDCYACLLNEYVKDDLHKNELQWAQDVLHQYFSTVLSHPDIDKARNRFEALQKPAVDEPVCVPFRHAQDSSPSITYSDLVQLARRRKSVRWYLPIPVPRELIDQAVAVASLSPSACNRQPFEFRIVDEPELVHKVISLPTGMGGFSSHIPVIVVVVGKLRAFESERDRHIIYIDGALASMTFMLALETLGLSSCPINWPDMEKRERKMANLLGLTPDERPILLIALGYPDPEGMVNFSQRKPVDELRRYNG